MSTSAAAELAVTAEHVERYRERVAAIARPLAGGNNDDAIAAIFEAERALRTAHRQLDRAARLLET